MISLNLWIQLCLKPNHLYCNREVWPGHWGEGRDCPQGLGSVEGGGLKLQLKFCDRFPYPWGGVNN